MFLSFLQKLPSIYIVLFCFLVLLPICIKYPDNNNYFGLCALALGSVLTLAKETIRPAQPSQNINVDSIENAQMSPVPKTDESTIKTDADAPNVAK